MKLLTKTTLIFLSVSVIVILIAGFLFYREVYDAMDEEACEALYQEKEQVVDFVTRTDSVPAHIFYLGDNLSFKKCDDLITTEMKDTAVYVTEEDEYLPYKILRFSIEVKNGIFVCTISKPLVESDDLVEGIVFSFSVVIVLFLLLLLIINHFTSKIIFKPFFQTIEKLKEYDVNQHKSLSFEPAVISEFKQLNEAITKMTVKISGDYQNLKAFSENASHEMQTPLAIIKTKTELLLQQESLNEEQAKQIAEINKAIGRLQKLNQTLLLLAKIENNQFMASEPLQFDKFLKEKLKQFEDLFAIKEFTIETEIVNDIPVLIHPVLADVVISNLLSNAIKYTPVKGKIIVGLTKEDFTVSNSGGPFRSVPDKLFERFHKEDPDSTSTGLGLALVKQAAQLCKHKIKYVHSGSMHHFSYSF